MVSPPSVIPAASRSAVRNNRASLARLELTPIAAALCAIAAGVGAGGPAFGQQQQPGTEKLEEVLVTGSRIVRRDFDAPSPIITVGTEVFQQNSSVAIEAVLNQYPQFNPGATQFTTGEIQPTATTSPGASTLNMRGLGANRSLVLLDGRRAQPVNAAMTVDVNTLPAAAIADVEVISGGAAATYGPDAMAGVVNFKLRKDFEGIDINYQTGFTDANDGEESRFDVLVGGNFDEDRGNAMFSVGYANREPAWEMNRDFFVEGFNDPGTPANYPRIDYPYYTPAANNLPSQAVVNQVLGTTTNQSRTVDFYTNPLDATVFRQQNALAYTGPQTFPYKIRTHNGSLEEGSPRSYASTPLTRYSSFGRANYDLTDKMSVFVQGTFVMTEVDTVLYPTPLTGVLVPHGSAIYAPSVDAQGNTLTAYRPGGSKGLNCAPTGGCTTSEAWPVPAELGALLDSRVNPNADFTLSRIAYWYPNRASSNNTKLAEFVVGVDGKIGDTDWTWEAYTSYGETVLLTDMKNFVWLDRYANLVRQPNYGKGGAFTAQAANSTNTQDFTCTSGLPLFEPWILGDHGEAQYYNDFQISQDCLTAVTARMTQKQRRGPTRGGGELPGQARRYARGRAARRVRPELAHERERVRARCVVPRDRACLGRDQRRRGLRRGPDAGRGQVRARDRRALFGLPNRRLPARRDVLQVLVQLGSDRQLPVPRRLAARQPHAERRRAVLGPDRPGVHVGGRRRMPRGHDAPVGQPRVEPEPGRDAAALRRAHLQGRRHTGPKPLRRGPRQLPDRRRRVGQRLSPAHDRQSSAARRNGRHLYPRHDLAAAESRHHAVRGPLRDRDRGRRRQPRVPDRVSAVFQRQRRQQPELLRRERVLPGDSPRSGDRQRGLRRRRQLQLEQALYVRSRSEPDLAQANARRRVRHPVVDQRPVLVAAAGGGRSRFTDARVRGHRRRRHLVLRLPVVHAVLVQQRQAQRRLELALPARGGKLREGADADADGGEHRGLQSVQHELLVAIQRAHAGARRCRQHRRSAAADRRREPDQREQPDECDGCHESRATTTRWAAATTSVWL